MSKGVHRIRAGASMLPISLILFPPYIQNSKKWRETQTRTQSGGKHHFTQNYLQAASHPFHQQKLIGNIQNAKNLNLGSQFVLAEMDSKKAENQISSAPNAEDAEEDQTSRFHGLPPLKRFKMLQKENKICPAESSKFCLPAKKRIWALRDFILDEHESPLELPAEKMACDWCRPTKKRSAMAHRKHSENPQLKQKIIKSKDEERDDEDGVICNVCRGQDGNSADPIVFCDGCNLMVHASCYGDPLIGGIPEGDWFCSRCARRPMALQEPCCLCPSSEGAMKCTTGGSWAHISCALLVPEVFFQCPEAREGIDCSMVPARRWGMVCRFCKMARGACIECSEPRCLSTFHISCGLDRDLSIEYMEGKAGGIVIGFCDIHTPKWQKQQETGKYKIVPRELVECGKKRKHSSTSDEYNEF